VLQKSVWEHRVKGTKAAALEADKPGEENSGKRSTLELERYPGDVNSGVET
jgi:hypothetical protein